MNSRKSGITAAQSRQAFKDLGLTLADASSGSGVSRPYLSEFHNGTRNLTIPQQKKLREYYEQQYEGAGLDFPEVDEASALGAAQHSRKMGFPRAGMYLHEDSVCADLSAQVVSTNIARLDDVAREIANIIKMPVTKKGFLDSEGDNGLNDDEQASLNKLVKLLAEESILRRRLEGMCIVGVVPANGKARSMPDALAMEFKHLIAGYLAPEPASPKGGFFKVLLDTPDSGPSDLRQRSQSQDALSDPQP